MGFLIVVLICFIIGYIVYSAFDSSKAEYREMIAELAGYLRREDWFNANITTNKIFHYVVKKQTKRKFDTVTCIQDFSCSTLHEIDHLWTKYSNGHFGLSVQKQIYKKCVEEFLARSDKDKVSIQEAYKGIFIGGLVFVDNHYSNKIFNDGRVTKEYILVDKLEWYFKRVDFYRGDNIGGIIGLEDGIYSLDAPQGHLPLISTNSPSRYETQCIQNIKTYGTDNNKGPETGSTISMSRLDLSLMIALWERLESCGS